MALSICIPRPPAEDKPRRDRYSFPSSLACEFVARGFIPRPHAEDKPRRYFYSFPSFPRLSVRSVGFYAPPPCRGQASALLIGSTVIAVNAIFSR
jgi:hypothetical protein